MLSALTDYIYLKTSRLTEINRNGASNIERSITLMQLLCVRLTQLH